MRHICALLPVLLCVLTAGAAGQGRTFDAVTTGFISAKLTGQSLARITPDGEMIVLLATSSPSLIAIVIRRDAGALPTAETTFFLVSDSCDNDPPSDADLDRAGGFDVSIRGGSLSAPEWAASAQSGTLTISFSGDSIAGRFDLSACGEHVESGDRVELTVKGAFHAGTSK